MQRGYIDYYVHIGQNGRMAKVPGNSKSAAASTALTVAATEAKTRFGRLLETAIRGGSVVITKHNTPKAVLLSMAEFEALGGSRPPDVNALRGEFDTLLARLQTPGNRKALKSAFEATPKELGRLAVANRRRRG
jgi:prevent-host-death family protein